MKVYENMIKKKDFTKRPNIIPFDWGKGTEKTSKEIDKIAYNLDN